MNSPGLYRDGEYPALERLRNISKAQSQRLASVSGNDVGHPQVVAVSLESQVIAVSLERGPLRVCTDAVDSPGRITSREASESPSSEGGSTSKGFGALT